MADLTATRPYRITFRQELAGHAIHLRLSPADGLPAPVWLPGQYLTLRLEIDGHFYMRSYSMLNTHGDPEILIKKVPNGAVSRYLIDHAQTGFVLEAYNPKGTFTLKSEYAGHPHVLLAAGSGIAPILSLARKLVSDSTFTQCYLHHGAREERELYFYEEFIADEATEHFRYQAYLSSQANRITPSILQHSIIPQSGRPAHECVFYICGPFVWMRSLRITLTYLGVPGSQIRVEQFAAPAPPPRLINQPFPGPCEASLQTVGGNAHFSIHLGQTILEAAEASGLHLPYSCRGGVCGSCTVRLSSGMAEMRQNEVLSPKDLAEGLTLTCTALPTTPKISLALQ